jgi:predicted 2-oxoglutarate/Fe(II)-dependent dioxygenase YbiX
VTPIHDAFVIRYEPGAVTDHLPLHHDVAQVSASVRLNHGYAGGELCFPRQSWDTGDLEVGCLVAWPSLVTHPHGAAPVTAGTKYGLTVWFALPG